MGHTIFNRMGLLGAVAILAACGAQQPSLSGEYDPTLIKIDGKASGISLSVSQGVPGSTKPKPNDITSVVINVDHMRLVLASEDKVGRLSLTPKTSSIDLLNLGQGLPLPLASTEVPKDIKLKQIRLVLASDGNFLQRSDGSVCQLKTPSQQQSGLKIIISGGGLSLEGGVNHLLALNFDADKSIVLQGNGGCLLKPVIHLKCHKHTGKNLEAVSCGITTDPTDPNDGSDDSPTDDSPTDDNPSDDNPPDDGTSDDVTNDDYMPPIDDPFLFF